MRKLNSLTRKETFLELSKEQQAQVKGGLDIKAVSDANKNAKDIKALAQSFQP